MKKILTYMTMVMAVALLAACDNRYSDNDYYDSDDAYTLEGTWTGYIESYFYDRFGKTGDEYRTTIYFERENHYGGWGYEVDYNIYSRYKDYLYCEFEWEVVNGIVRINYADTWNTVEIYPTRLTNSHFAGRMYDGTNRDIYFDLTYDGSFNWGPYRDYFYAPTRSGAGIPRFHASGEFAL